METEKKQKKLNTKVKLALGSVGALAVLFTAGIGSMAFAQTGSTSTSSTFLDKVASIVGVDPQKLKDGFSQVSTSSIDEKLASGEITQEQATKMKEDVANGRYFGFGDKGPHGDRGGDMMRIDFDKIATFLGLSKDDLMKKHDDEDLSLSEIALAQGKSEADLKTFLSNLFDENLKTAVESGKLTQVKADEIKAKKDTLISDMISHKGFGGGRGKRNFRPEQN